MAVWGGAGSEARGVFFKVKSGPPGCLRTGLGGGGRERGGGERAAGRPPRHDGSPTRRCPATRLFFSIPPRGGGARPWLGSRRGKGRPCARRSQLQSAGSSPAQRQRLSDHAAHVPRARTPWLIQPSVDGRRRRGMVASWLGGVPCSNKGLGSCWVSVLHICSLLTLRSGHGSERHERVADPFCRRTVVQNSHGTPATRCVSTR